MKRLLPWIAVPLLLLGAAMLIAGIGAASLWITVALVVKVRSMLSDLNIRVTPRSQAGSSRACAQRNPRPCSTRLGSRYWRTKACQRGSVLLSASLFGPNRWVHAAASAELRPFCPSTPSERRT